MTTQELYDAIIRKPDLHSTPKLYDNILVWHLYKNAYVQAFCNDGDSSIEIVGDSVWAGSIMYWHPDEGDIDGPHLIRHEDIHVAQQIRHDSFFEVAL